MSKQLADVIVGMLDLGSLYALVGIGFVVLYRSTRVINFAQGSLMLLGAELFGTLIQLEHITWWIALAITMAAVGIVCVVVYAGIFRHFVGRELFVVVIATFGLNIVLETVITLFWGPDTRSLPLLLSEKAIVSVGQFGLSPIDLFSIGMAVVGIAVLELALRRTRFGTQMRAVADGPVLASQMRVSINRAAAAAWAIAGICAGGAGAMFAMRVAIDPAAIPALGLLAIPAIFLGGIDSMRGALVGGFLLALAQNGATFLFGGIWSDVVAYAVLLIVIVVRPSGLFGTTEAARL